MPKPGEKAELWMKENVQGSPTCASGAKFHDADYRGPRNLYECKMTDKPQVLIRAKAVNTLLNRAAREHLNPVFFFWDGKDRKYFIQLARDFLNRMEELGWQDIIKMYRESPGIISKRGKSIRLTKEVAQRMYDTGTELIKFYRHDEEVWVIVEASTWLEVTGEGK